MPPEIIKQESYVETRAGTWGFYSGKLTLTRDSISFDSPSFLFFKAKHFEIPVKNITAIEQYLGLAGIKVTYTEENQNQTEIFAFNGKMMGNSETAASWVTAIKQLVA